MTSSDHDRTPGRILVVDDDLVVGRFLTDLLGDRGGFDVTHTTDPAAALKRASSEKWDLVLTDVEMPGMTGLELLEALRRAAPDLPVVVLTGHPSVDYAVRALRDHADEFLQKSMPPDQLLASISSVVAKGRAARLAARQSVLAIGAGTLPLTVASGVDMPRMALDSLRGRPLPDHAGFRDTAMVRYLQECFIELGEVRQVAA